MKREEITDMKTESPKQWLSLEQWRKDPEFAKFVENEFQSSPLAEGGVVTKEGGWARREFLKLMGASMALTSFGCVRRPAQKIVPYANRPAELVPGDNSYYTSSFVDGNEGFGLVVTAREGRPIKAEGNPSHPVNKGKMSVRAHAQILDLYDPDRLSGGKKGSAAIKFEDLDKEVKMAIAAGGVALLTGSVVSPAKGQLLRDFGRKVNADHYVWDAITEEYVRQGQEECFGKSIYPRYRYNKAKYFLSIGSDFLGTEGHPTEANVQFGEVRKPGEGMAKLVSFESILSLTGMNADTRYRVRPSQLLDVVLGILHHLVIEKGHSKYSSDNTVKAVLEGYGAVNERLGLPEQTIENVAKELWGHRGESLVLAGSQGRNALDLQIATNFLNVVLENDGKTIDAGLSSRTGYQGSTAGLKKLIEEMNKGSVKTLIINGVNPVYSAPRALGFAEALKKVKTVVYVGRRADETGEVSTFTAAESHSMEAWGDAELQEGVYSIQQPTIRPLGESRSLEEHLMAWAPDGTFSSASYYDYLRDYWKNTIQKNNRTGIAKSDFEDFWLALLEEGVFDTVGDKRDRTDSARRFNTSALKKMKKMAAGGDYEVVLYQKSALRDGQLANVAWLQELPDPVTKVVWDNYVMVSLKTAHTLGLETGNMAELKVGNEVVKVPVLVQPGTDDHTLALALGYGRTAAGQVGNGIGVNAFPLIALEEGVASFVADASLSKTSGRYKLANPQGHHAMEGRQIVVEATLEQYLSNPEANIHRHKMMTMWSKHEYNGIKWGMNIDLNACTGCSACVVACQSENNIPTVGKQYVIEGRIMHWIRVDRYYAGEPTNPEALFMPVTCMHCDNAPCETVCPVAATVHSTEGLNDMVYNRCVGTRYCANNCPYKVRRFNWFDYVKDVKSPQHLALNPEVSVRERGVMEKCSFCTHRIKTAKHDAKVEGRELKDGDVVTACQQSCPTNAITFGDVNDSDSLVSKAMGDKRTYALLEELNAAPALKYRSKIRNAEKIFSSNQGHGEGHH